VDRTIAVSAAALTSGVAAEWFNPRTGDRTAANRNPAGDAIEFTSPAEGDWLLALNKRN
jgi:hypothetical protein